MTFAYHLLRPTYKHKEMQESSLHLIYAPPGFGKTTGLMEVFEKTSLSLVFLSPLRAIAEEVLERALARGHCVQWGGKSAPDKKTFIASTFESFSSREFNADHFLFVIDEFHLIYYWGDDFRPRLFETYYCLAAMGATLLALSATIMPSLFERVKQDALIAFDQFYYYDLGGGTLLYKPKYELNMKLFSRAEQLKLLSLYLKFSGKRALVFCSRRQDVLKVRARLREEGLLCAHCLGGGVQDFLADTRRQEPQVIVATSVLSHGVNLGAIRLVCFLDPVENNDFYLQMLARGGRDGGGFIVVQRQTVSIAGFLLQLILWPFIKLLCHATL